jgi:hypothetical protein
LLERVGRPVAGFERLTAEELGQLRDLLVKALGDPV